MRDAAGGGRRRRKQPACVLVTSIVPVHSSSLPYNVDVDDHVAEACRRTVVRTIRIGVGRRHRGDAGRTNLDDRVGDLRRSIAPPPDERIIPGSIAKCAGVRRGLTPPTERRGSRRRLRRRRRDQVRHDIDISSPTSSSLAAGPAPSRALERSWAAAIPARAASPPRDEYAGAGRPQRSPRVLERDIVGAGRVVAIRRRKVSPALRMPAAPNRSATG